jgi:2-polyprenyl-6-hydroxyphenyl methylase/3-demethylubiquinone-9 3-methyltransferase
MIPNTEEDSPESGGEQTKADAQFTFGRNWKRYLDALPEGARASMKAYVASWLGPDLAGRTLADVGSGQGLTSLAAFELGATVLSFDLDPDSVEATKRLWMSAGSPQAWRIVRGSILDGTFIEDLGTYDVVVSWGVLHHTGHLWKALEAASTLVAPGGRLWIALYHRTPRSDSSLRTKRFYASLPGLGKKVFRGGYATAKALKNAVVRRRLPNMSGAYDERGMNWWRDIEDWLGGLPYEVSSPGEVLGHLRPKGFELDRLADGLGEGGNDVYLFVRRDDGVTTTDSTP